MTYLELVSRFGPKGEPRQQGAGFMLKCPAHEDKQHSLSIGQGADGRILISCHARCRTEDVLARIGCKMADLFPEDSRAVKNFDKNFCQKPATESQARPLAKPTAKNGSGKAYDYCDENGALKYQSVRFEPKDFRQRQPDGNGWKWTIKGVTQLPYRLPELIRAINEQRPVYIVEGEKDVDRLYNGGFAATCNSGGANKWPDELNQWFDGADVVLIPDNDEPGRKHVEEVGSNLENIAARVRVLTLPELLVKGDVSDWFDNGGDKAVFDKLTDEAPGFTTTDGKQLATPIFELVRPVTDDGNELLKHRFLCRGGGALLCGPTGIGKSSLSMQAMLSFSLGNSFFGITPARPLSSLLVQAENDDGDLAEMRDSVVSGMQLTFEMQTTVGTQVAVCTVDDSIGTELFERLDQLLTERKPDLLWLDPAMAYLGGDASSQKDVGGFLRNGINPLIHKHQCGIIIVHHTNKPPSGREKSAWAGGDFAYLGAGSAEWANWARAVLNIRSLGSHSTFELQAGKRGARLNWKDDAGERTFSQLIAHSKEPGRIFWNEGDPNDLPSVGRPKAAADDDVFAILPRGGLTHAEWKRQAADQYGVTKSTFDRILARLRGEEKVFKSSTDHHWQPNLKACSPKSLK